MKTKHLFWGFLFITLGFLVLINNFTTLDFYWSNMWEFWPLVLILLGISLLIKNDMARAIFVSLIGIALGAAIFSTIQSGWGFFHNEVFHGRHRIEISDNDKNYKRKEFREDYSDNIKNASLYFKSDAGSFNISDTTGSLFYAVTKGYDYYNLNRIDKEDFSKIDFQNKSHRFFIFGGKNKNNVEMILNSNPVWNLKFDIGAASAEFDLRKLKIGKLNVDAGAASLKIILGDSLESSEIEIDAGASSVEISIPEEAGCEIKSDIVLSKKKFEGFKKTDDDVYRTENFNSAVKKIFMNIDSGVSSIKINRYSNEDWDSVSSPSKTDSLR